MKIFDLVTELERYDIERKTKKEMAYRAIRNYCGESDSRCFINVHEMNPSAEVPYHNDYHSHTMVVNCLNMANELRLPTDDISNLLIAALFHDYAHGAGTESGDHINIFRAQQKIMQLNEMGALSYDRASEICKIIAVTEFPFVRVPGTTSEKIIRDADLMSCLEPCWKIHVMYGLRREINTKIIKKAGGDWFAQQNILTVKDFMQAQLNFIRTAEFFTGLVDASKFQSVFDEIQAELDAMNNEIEE